MLAVGGVAGCGVAVAGWGVACDRCGATAVGPGLELPPEVATTTAIYNATYFLGMLNEIGGVATARKLVMSQQPAEGFTRLWEMRRLDLSVEALVLQPRWRALFTDDERRAAKRRLDDYRRSPI